MLFVRQGQRVQCTCHLLWGTPLLLQQRNTSHHISHIVGTLTTSYNVNRHSQPLMQEPKHTAHDIPCHNTGCGLCMIQMSVCHNL